jgi:hypothetical protein
MAKNTQSVTQYEIYTLRRLFKTLFIDQERDSMEEVAIFDDNDLAEAYKAKAEASTVLPKGTLSQSFEIQSSWVELEPVAENFNLPFNPTYVEPEARAPKVVKSKRVVKE